MASPFAVDNFVDVDGTPLLSHTMDVGGPWIRNSNAAFASAAPVIDANHVRPTPYTLHAFYATADPPTADQDVGATVVRPVNNDVWYIGPMARMDPANDTGYTLRTANNASVDLVQRVLGASTILGTYAAAIGNADPRALRLVVKTLDAATVQIEVYVGGIKVATVLDTSVGRITAKGKVGFWDQGGGVTNDGFILTAFSATDVGTPALPPPSTLTTGGMYGYGTHGGHGVRRSDRSRRAVERALDKALEERKPPRKKQRPLRPIKRPRTRRRVVATAPPSPLVSPSVIAETIQQAVPLQMPEDEQWLEGLVHLIVMDEEERMSAA